MLHLAGHRRRRPPLLATQSRTASTAEIAPDDHLHTVFEPTAKAIKGLEQALAALGVLDEALTLDLWRPQDYFHRTWSPIDELNQRLTGIVERQAPQLLAQVGIGPDSAVTLLITMGDNPERLGSEASFAALCGVRPIEYSSGGWRSRRLNHGGDRQANAALHRIVFTRLRHDSRTQAYYERRTQEGKTRREIIRCLKRYAARKVFNLVRTVSTRPPVIGASVTAVTRRSPPPEHLPVRASACGGSRWRGVVVGFAVLGLAAVEDAEQGGGDDAGAAADA
ncbi:transposase [Streptomyces sp. NBC_01396]|uniref:transposase n=1 Tax=Streptomyces sp. NBC_01396 TaxID=2903852 RepID=UPI00386E4F1F